MFKGFSSFSRTLLKKNPVQYQSSRSSHQLIRSQFIGKANNNGRFLWSLLGLGTGLGLALLIPSIASAKEEEQKECDKSKSCKLTCEQVTQISKSIAAILDAGNNYDDGSYGPLFIRLAWHCAGTYDKKSNGHGSRGATMRFEPECKHGANAGLHIARNLLEPIKKANPAISYADLYTLAGIVAFEEMGGGKVKWWSGRKDEQDGKACPPDGRLPDASKGATHIREVFERMGFNDREIVALIGLHCVGRCHTDRSGFSGPWTRSPTMVTNHFFVELLNNKWQKKKWSGPEQFEDAATKELMMLPADLALLDDPKFKSIAVEFSKDEDLFLKECREAFSKLLGLGHPSCCH